MAIKVDIFFNGIFWNPKLWRTTKILSLWGLHGLAKDNKVLLIASTCFQNTIFCFKILSFASKYHFCFKILSFALTYPSSFSFIKYNFCNKLMWKLSDPSSIRRWDSNPRPREHEPLDLGSLPRKCNCYKELSIAVWLKKHICLSTAVV